MFEQPQQQLPQTEASHRAGARQPSDPEIFVMPDVGPQKPPRWHLKIKMPVVLGIGGGLFVVGLVIVAFLVLQPKKAPPRVTQAVTPPIVNQKIPVPPPGGVTASTGTVMTPPAQTTPSGTPQVSPPTPPQVLAFGADDDSDGLTNEEERLIYKTDPLNPDTDHDGFLDGNEVFHLYNPAAPTPAKLLGSEIIRVYENKEFGYSIFYPSVWAVSQVATGTPEDVIIKTTTGELVSLTVSDNSSNASLFDWYSREAREGNTNGLEPITTKGGYQGLQTANRLTTYLALPKKVLIVSFNIGDKTQVNYRRTYEMMLNSLIAK